MVNLIGSAATSNVTASPVLIIAGALFTGRALLRQIVAVLQLPLPVPLPFVINPENVTLFNMLEKVQELVAATCIYINVSVIVTGIVKSAVVAVVAPMATLISLMVA